MKVHLGEIPPSTSPSPEAEGFVRAAGPSSALAHAAAWLIGIATLSVLIALILASSLFAPRPLGEAPAFEPTPWATVVLTLFLAVPAHELLHAAFHPDRGLSSATIFVAWPKKLRFGVFYEGYMSRRRWLAMRLAPFVILSIVPAALLAAPAGIPRNFAVETSLALLLLVNALGSGGDILAAAWVVSHIPGGSTLAFRGGKAYWKAE